MGTGIENPKHFAIRACFAEEFPGGLLIRAPVNE